MKILVVGSGGREHVLVWKLAQSPHVSKVFCAPGNGGTGLDGENVPIPVTEIGQLLTFVKEHSIDLTVVGPEAPLVEGIVDDFRAAGLRIFGPTREAAQLEGSKVFAKDIMRRAGVPTADYRSFSVLHEAITWIDSLDESPVVVKANGLAAGKGVVMCQDRHQAKEAVTAMLHHGQFGSAGHEIVIEEMLVGQEASILAIVDRDTIIPLATSQDHKRANDGDQGLNTGGMGAYSPTPVVTDKMMDEIIKRILVPTVHEMKVQSCQFSGVLYAGLMLTQQGPRVLEFNVRFGDPEVQPVLMRLRSDLAQVLSLAADGRLAELEGLDWDPRPSVCVVMAAEGYPGDYDTGHRISGIAEADCLKDTKVFHAGTSDKMDGVVTSGGRVLGVTAMGDDFHGAKQAAYTAVKLVRWQGCWNRSDIADMVSHVESSS